MSIVISARNSGTLVVRLNDMGMFFYDVINIKKETSTPGES